MVMTMNKNTSYDSNFNFTIKPEQFTQLIEAIFDGKYSWTCILILRFAGYNPLLYIPHRTYNRLLKENNQPQHNKVAAIQLSNSVVGRKHSKI